MDVPSYSKPRHEYGEDLSFLAPPAAELLSLGWAGRGFSVLNEESAR